MMSQADLRKLFSLLAEFRAQHVDRGEPARIVEGEVAALIVRGEGGDTEAREAP